MGNRGFSQGDFVVLNQGSGTITGNQAVIAPGTGLGEAGLFWDGTGISSLPAKAATRTSRPKETYRSNCCVS